MSKCVSIPIGDKVIKVPLDEAEELCLALLKLFPHLISGLIKETKASAS